MNKQDLSIKNIRERIIAGTLSAYEITLEYLSQIEDKNKAINAFISFRKDKALSEAKQIDENIKLGKECGPLCGVPIAVKDNILIESEITTAGSKILENYISAYDATVIKKIKNAGAIILGKTNMDEFAMGSSNESSAYGVVKNPINLEYVPGGSSGGSAAAVAGDMVLGALGSDTGGSIRLPAAFCGVVGMKPTYGMVSRFGLIAMASSLDQIGPFAKTVSDAEEIYSVIKGKDINDQTSLDINKHSINVNNPKSITIGIPEELYSADGIDKETSKAIEESIYFFRSHGMNIKKINLPHSKYALSVYYIIMFAEVATNLARIDGIRYVRKGDKHDSLLDIYLETRGAGFGEEVKRRIMMGNFVLSAGHYDAYYTKAQKVRELISQDFINSFSKVDIIFSPTSPSLPFKLGEKNHDPIQMYLSDILTIPANLAGLPAISIPVKNRINNLPIGLQFIGKAWHDADLFELGKFYENLK